MVENTSCIEFFPPCMENQYHMGQGKIEGVGIHSEVLSTKRIDIFSAEFIPVFLFLFPAEYTIVYKEGSSSFFSQWGFILVLNQCEQFFCGMFTQFLLRRKMGWCNEMLLLSFIPYINPLLRSSQCIWFHGKEVYNTWLLTLTIPFPGKIYYV